MNSHSRRQFFRTSLSSAGSVWLASRWPSILAAKAYAQDAAKSPIGGFQFFSQQEAAEIEAMAAQIIPSDDLPGAREARAIYFIDRILVTLERDKQPAYKQGIHDLQRKADELFPPKGKFSALTSGEQIEVLTAIEKTDFFELLRFHTIMGFLANPEYGGNYEKVGWRLIGLEDETMFTPPFGYYDSPGNKDR
jgi:gluconate 2-dehydrogenase gamma chain